MSNSNRDRPGSLPAPEPWWMARFHRPLTPEEQAECDRLTAANDAAWQAELARLAQEARQAVPTRPSDSTLLQFPPAEQERYLRTIGQPWRDHLRSQYGLPEPLTNDERARLLRDIVCYPDAWREALLAVLTRPIIDAIILAIRRDAA
jgi:hypothetical protein